MSQLSANFTWRLKNNELLMLAILASLSAISFYLERLSLHLELQVGRKSVITVSQISERRDKIVTR